MSVFGKDIDTKVENMVNEWIKAEEFEKSPVLKFKSVEKIRSQYGAKATDSIVAKKILEEGETFRYIFEDIEGNSRKHDSTSFPLFIGIQEAQINEDDWLKITREGIKDKTRYYVEVVGEPTEKPVSPRNSAPTADINPDDIPF